MNFFKQIIVFLVLTSLIGSFITSPTKAHAQGFPAPIGIGTNVPVFDPSQYQNDLWSYLQEIGLAIVKRQILDELVDQIIVWIQGGGKPKFVTDWGGFLEEAGDRAVGDFLRSNPYTNWLCDPFRFQVDIYLFPVKRFQNQVTCTLTDVVENINGFYNDFRDGGWIAFHESLKPQNNFYGVTIITSNEILNRRAEAQANALNEALAGSGYLGTKRCDEDPNYGSGGSSISTDDALASDIDGDGIPGDIQNTCITTTPGTFVADAVSGIAIDAGIVGPIISAKEISEYITAIANAAINKVIENGDGLLGI
ncbi:MAG: hypothetical protein COU07_03795 [Candidatus Harrisonbacteria bacterium CG10_big_fil_rev_8_21_14_0_10_40_38]|uniref:Uncharacterized protein n=1 Tax=Candidatus Harrisonbacteria bacterium CG10_big_fil_rev_8_21_14_0_10_40_38 TaxID=1974583 RepID=A0A2H0UT74_9BACT|nr:MAG: hypothetical protein COU07_03795 [Candidatus Harrisonbacteria bacterium CG10_big_fil_rev_8_21_14_0_10_40_38]